MWKKLIAFMTVFGLMLAPVGINTLDDVQARGYKSGKKSFQPSQYQKITPKKEQNRQNNMNSNKKKENVNQSAAQKSGKGSFVKGMLLGGLGGLLVGSLFSNMGPLGPVFAFIVNMLVLVGIIMIIRSLFLHFKRQRKEQRGY